MEGESMKLRCLASSLVLLCAASFASAQNPGAVTPKPLSPLEQALVSNAQQMIQAQRKKDVEYFKGIVADDFAGVGSDGTLYDKHDLLEAVRIADVQELTPYEFSVVQVNESSAIVTYNCVVRMMVFDETEPRYQHISNVWVRQGDVWQLKFQQSTTTR
jgi:hypothetical protein